MVTKFILIVWVGFFDNQVLTTEKFDTRNECERAKEAIAAEIGKKGVFKCVPY